MARRPSRVSFRSFRASVAGMLLLLALCAASSTLARQSDDRGKKPKDRSLAWDPPTLDSRVRTTTSALQCELPKLLAQAAASESEQVTNLQNFTAQEKIQYQTYDRQGFVSDLGSQTFEYIVLFEKTPGGLQFQENRNPIHGSSLTPTANQDLGLPEMVLIFLPNMQDDYDMRCEGLVKWGGQDTWLVHFEQRKDKPSRTYSFRVDKVVHLAKLKGRAWILADTGQVVHMETGLIEPVAGVGVQHSYLSIDYAPVQFQAQAVRIWLPKQVEGFWDFGERRTIVYHTFSDFMLFSVETEQKIEKPKQP